MTIVILSVRGAGFRTRRHTVLPLFMKTLLSVVMRFAFSALGLYNYLMLDMRYTARPLDGVVGAVR